MRTMRKLLGVAALLVALLAMAAPAFAQSTEGYGDVAGTVVTAPPARPAPVVQAAAPQQASGGLAFTGADVFGTAAVGLALVGLGVVLVRKGGRRDDAAV